MSSEPGKRRQVSQDELDYQDQIEQELDDLDEMYLFGMQVGHIPGGYPEGWDEDMEAHYLGEAMPDPDTEGDVSSSPEEWREFLRKIEEDLG